MTSSEIRIAVAKALGWEKVEWYEDSAGPPILHGFPPLTIGLTPNGDWDAKREQHSKRVPNYPESLDDCSCFEKTLNRQEQVAYLHSLWEVCSEGGEDVYSKVWAFDDDTFGWWGILVHATPLQRCIAFLKVKGGWNE